MKAKLLGAVAIALLLILVFAVVAQAAVPQSVIDAIIKDAQDNSRVDGNWSAAEVQAALDWAAKNPTLVQYSAVEGVLTDFLGSLNAPGTQGGQLAFTGSEVLLVLGAGMGLIGSGLALRRRRA